MAFANTRKDKLSGGIFTSIILIATIIISLLFVSISYASDIRFETTKDALTKADFNQKIYGGEDPSAVTINSEGNTVTRAGFDAVYGVGMRTTTYNGEVPLSSDLSKEKPSRASDVVNGMKRVWANNPDKLGLDWSDDNKITDLHAKPLLEPRNVILDFLGAGGNLFANIIESLLNGLVGIATSIVDILIMLANYDPIDLVATIVGFPDFYENIMKLIIGSNGGLSPVFIVALVVFMIGFVGALIKFFASGATSAMQLKEEALIFLLAMVLTGVAFIPGGAQTSLNMLMTNTSKFLSDSISELNISTKSELQSYSWETSNGQSTYASAKTQSSLLRKSLIDLNIKNQFGIPVDELNLTPDNWGLSQDQLDNILKNLGEGKDGKEVFKVSTSVDGNGDASDVINLGYYWYATTSKTNPSNPYSQDAETKEIQINSSASDEGILFIIDFVSAIAAVDGSDYQKCETIINNFQNGGSANLVGNIMNIFVQIGVGLALLLPAIFTLMNKAIFSIGFLAVPILPITLLIKQFRDFSKKAFFTWVNGALKALILQTFVLFIVYVPATLMVDYGNGIIVCVVFLVAMIFMGNKFCQAIQTNVGFRDSLDNRFSHRMSMAARSLLPPGLRNPSFGGLASAARNKFSSRGAVSSNNDYSGSEPSSGLNNTADNHQEKEMMHREENHQLSNFFEEGSELSNEIGKEILAMEDNGELEDIQSEYERRAKEIDRQNDNEAFLYAMNSGELSDKDAENIKGIMQSVGERQDAANMTLASWFANSKAGILLGRDTKLRNALKARTKQKVIDDINAKVKASEDNASFVRAYIPFGDTATKAINNYRRSRAEKYQNKFNNGMQMAERYKDSQLKKLETLTVEYTSKDGKKSRVKTGDYIRTKIEEGRTLEKRDAAYTAAGSVVERAAEKKGIKINAASNSGQMARKDAQVEQIRQELGEERALEQLDRMDKKRSDGHLADRRGFVSRVADAVTPRQVKNMQTNLKFKENKGSNNDTQE